MDIILCHQTADFDALGAAVGLTRLKKGAKIVLTGGAHPTVKDFLALHKDEFNLIERRSVDLKKVRSIIVVDTQYRDRLGKAKDWFDHPHIKQIELYDHHLGSDSDIPTTFKQIEAVGSSTTIITEKLQEQNIQLTSFEATVMALGIHVDTGSLTYEQTTPRDALALAWLMQQGANIRVIAEYVEPSLTPTLQKLLTQSLETLKIIKINTYQIGWILLNHSTFIPGLSTLASHVIDLTECDVLLYAHCYRRNREEEKEGKERLTVIGRSRIKEVNLHHLFKPLGGGGHAQASALTLSQINVQETLEYLLEELKKQIPHPPIARDLMSSPVRTIRPHTTIEEAQRILFRYGHSGLSVVDEKDQLVGIISRRDIDLALHHGFSHAPVKGYMTHDLKTITPTTPLAEIEALMVTYDVGRLPVLKENQLVGIVTRTDVLRQLHEDRQEKTEYLGDQIALTACLLPSLKNHLTPPIWALLHQASKFAYKQGWHLYLVGGAVRDLLLAKEDEKLLLQDIDLVVDGFNQSSTVEAGVILAKLLQKAYPHARLSVHGAFQTAALLWHKDEQLGSLWVDIATARTEFYPYPASNPEVEASSIRQDLYRRDFTINALAVRLTKPKEGILLDYFGGILDIRSTQIRVLHPNSFIEDPTRIYRAVRFAVRLGFNLEPQTESYIRYAIESGIYERLRLEHHPAPALTTRLRAEFQIILEAQYWKRAVLLLNDLGALRCLHPQLSLTPQLWWQMRYLSRWLAILDPDQTLEHWKMRLEILIADLPHEERSTLAHRLQLSTDSCQRLQSLATIEQQIKEQLPHCHCLSETVTLLSVYKVPNLILIAVRSDRPLRQTLWTYLTQWRFITPPINGHDLKQMGIKPSPLFKRILDDLLVHTLDGKIQSRQEAENYIKTHYHY